MTQQALVGVDVGGTRIKVVALARGAADGTATQDPTPLAEAVLPTPRDIGSRMGEVVREAVDALHVEASVAAIGVVVPGLVEERSGLARYSANLGWRDLPVVEHVRAATGVEVGFGHDVRAGLLGESRYGAARLRDDVLFVPLGTGVAGALLSGGRLVLGSEWTGEIGHVVVDPAGPPCGCGARGCLEVVAGAAALGRAWSEVTGQRVGADDLAHAVAQGEKRAVALWQHAVRVLTDVVAPVLAGAGSRLLLLGGGLSNAGSLLTEPVTERLRLLMPGREIEVAVASLGDRAAALGAVALAADALAADALAADALAADALAADALAADALADDALAADAPARDTVGAEEQS
ncbi:ROK family protein [Ornithinimicrobium sp. Y1847]|uniref:ROK family protein n=1 Tax=Ornithinimicrobium sp. Y1847 TaxID=3405419 RepID=UPI003B6758C7